MRHGYSICTGPYKSHGDFAPATLDGRRSRCPIGESTEKKQSRGNGESPHDTGGLLGGLDGKRMRNGSIFDDQRLKMGSRGGRGTISWDLLPPYYIWSPRLNQSWLEASMHDFVPRTNSALILRACRSSCEHRKKQDRDRMYPWARLAKENGRTLVYAGPKTNPRDTQYTPTCPTG